MESNLFKIVFNIRYTLYWLRGRVRLLFNCRRSRRYWPDFDNAYLWHGEEAYEYNHSGDIDEYIDVLGTLMVLQVFHNSDFHNRIRRSITVNKSEFRRATLKWWLRQTWRGRPNLDLRVTYYHFLRIHVSLTGTTKNKENEKSSRS